MDIKNLLINALMFSLFVTGAVLADDGWTSLFNGKSLDGWLQKNGTATYRIEDGTIVGKTKEGSPNSFLCTTKEYGDFELEFEVKVHDRLNSGVQIRSKTKEPPKGAKFGRVYGPQVEIESGPAEAGYVYGEATGLSWLTPSYRLVPHQQFKNGEWNKFRVIAQGPRIQTWINGTMIEDLTHKEIFKSHPKGFIGLQVHGIGKDAGPYEVAWRNLRIREASGILPKPTGKEIVSPDATLELLFTRTADIQGGLTEGPAVAPDGSIYFSDIPFGKDKGMILRFDPQTKKTTVFAEDSHKSNGLIFDSKGFLLACEGADNGGRCYSRWNVKSGKRTVVADSYEGKRFNAPNDICLDRQGRMYVSDPRYLGDEPRELEHRAVYRIEKDGTVIEITHNIKKPNGIAISPDGKTLYVADHDNGTDKIDPKKAPPQQGDMKIYAYPLDEDGKSTGKRETFVDFGKEKGCDGMCVDEKGNVYLTVRSANRPGVMIVNPKGKEIAFIPTGPQKQKIDADHPPVGLPSNVEFGIKEESNMLYVTIDKSLYRIRLKVKGFHVQYEQ